MMRIDSAEDSIINMPLSISDFPSDGIIYTADAVMFHRDAIKRWLPACKPYNFDQYGSSMMNVNQLRDLIIHQWGNEKYRDLVSTITDSAIAYKPSEDQQIYLFSGNGGFYIVHCNDAMHYLSMIRSHKLLFDRKPLAQKFDLAQTQFRNFVTNEPSIGRLLREQDIKLVNRGHKIWLAVGPIDGMQEKLIAAFNPPPATKPAPPKVYEPGPSHA